MRRKCATVAAVVMLLFAAAPSSAVAACGPAQQRPERPNQPYPDPRLPKGLTPADFEAYRAVVETFRTGSETAPPPPPGWTSQRYQTIVAYLTAKRPYWGQPGTPLEPWNPPLVAAAVAYHTWTAVHAQSNIVTGHRIHALHIDVARQLLDLVNDEELPPRFRRLWMLTVAAFMMDRLVLGDTLTHIDEAVNRYPDDIALHLAAGAFAELMASPHITLPDVSGTNRHVIALLQQRKLQGLDLARSHYRIVLGIAPSNSEAHLRLGRVLLQAPDGDDGIEHLRAAARSDDRRISYLAHVFLAGAFESRGDPVAALDAYRAADGRMQGCQAATLGLSHVLRATGRIDEAMAAARRVLAQPPPACDDPSWDYLVGPARRTVILLNSLAGLVR